jgi:hypothetical protein
MRNTFQAVFLSHPQTVNESYTEHAGVAFRYSARLFVASCAALVHAIIPSLCKTTASTAIREMHQEMQARVTSAKPH